MSLDTSHPTETILERLDLFLARHLTAAGEKGPMLTKARQFNDFLIPAATDERWVANLLKLRGLDIEPQDVARVLAGKNSRFRREHQEYSLIQGLNRVLAMIREAASQGLTPDGWFLAEMFKVFTRNVARFHNNSLRKDEPWDGALYTSYPDPSQIEHLLDTFDAPHCYRDVPQRFDALHPVRQSFRILWRFARISPFPDFNVVMGSVAMDAYLLAKGYPPVPKEAGDRELLGKIVTGPPPLRIVQFESRLLSRVEDFLH